MSISTLTKKIKTYKIPVTLPFYQFLKPEWALKNNNISNLLNVLSDNNKKNLGVLNIDK